MIIGFPIFVIDDSVTIDKAVTSPPPPSTKGVESVSQKSGGHTRVTDVSPKRSADDALMYVVVDRSSVDYASLYSSVMSCK